MKLFKKKKREECFFCKVNLAEETTFTLQYSSAEGVHTAVMCGECAKTFDELADMKEEAYGSRFNSI
jgi:RNase P subunit RPR2